MAVTFHNATVTAGPASVGTATILHTISGADACLLVFTHANTAVSFSAIAANGLSLTRLGHISASSSRAEVWGLSAAPIATYSISANVVGAASLNFCLVAVSYRGQATIGVNPFGTVVAGTAQGVANVAFSVSSTSTDLVVYGFGISANTTITLNTGTSRGNTTHTTTGRLVVGEITGASVISISATAAAAGTWSFLGVPIVASAVQVTTLALDNATFTAVTSGINSLGMLLTATSNAVLLVWTHQGAAATISAVVVGSNNLTFLGGIDYRAGVGTTRTELWGLTAPPTGILTISAVIVGATVTFMGLGAVTYTGQRNSATPFGGVVLGSGSSTAQVGLVISSTVGNIVVVGFGGDQDVSGGPGTVNRIIAPLAFPKFLVNDAPGYTNVSVSATSSVVTTNWGGIGINLIQAGFRSANAAMTDIADKLSATGYVLVRGSISCTAAADKFSASGYVIVTGRLSATDAADRFSASGYVIVQGRLSATDVTDKFSASGQVINQSRLSATDVTDKFSASGYVVVSGRLSATGAADIFSASGTVLAVGNVTGLLTATEAADFFSASGTVIAVATPSVTVTQDPGAGGGHKRKKEYVRQDDAFWEAREKYLVSLQPAIATEPEAPAVEISPITAFYAPPIDPSLLIAYRATRAKLITALPKTFSIRRLKAHGKRLQLVNYQIAEQKRLQAIADEQARLAAKAERQRRREQSIRRIKRRVVLLAAARAAVALTHLYGKL